MFKPYRFLVSACLLGSLFPSASPAQSNTVQARAELQEMQQVEDAWSAAVTRRDQYALENVLSPHLVDIAATGDVTTRNQDVAKLFVKDALPASLKQTVIDVRTLTAGVKVVNGTYVMHWVAPSSAPSGASASVDEKGVFTHVFQLVNGRWVCVNSQRTVVAEQQPAVKTKTSAPRAKSNAAEPFHIPLIYKGAQPAQPATTTPAPQ
jgi:ketosteroid isomerase-like protein